MPNPKKSKLTKVIEHVERAISESGKFYSGKAPDTMFSKKTNKKTEPTSPESSPAHKKP